MTYFLPIASGSSGNTGLYICGRAKILIDAGTNTKTIRNCIATMGLSVSDLTHIFITHTHKDHISALPVLMKHTNAKLYVSDKAYSDLEQDLMDITTPFQYGQTIDAMGVAVRSFPTPHDSYGSVGFTLNDGKNAFAYCTDLGHITDEISQTIKGVHTLYIESNHDLEMLQKGPYPYFLKQRILSDNGHISNVECSRFATRSAEKGTKNIMLAHLSEQNNHPGTALLEMENALYKAGATQDVQVRVAQKRNTAPPIHIG